MTLLAKVLYGSWHVVENVIVMGHTATEKILAKKSGKEEVKPGEVVVANVDMVFLHSPASRYEWFDEIGGVKGVWDPDKIVLGLGHHMFSPNDAETAAELRSVRERSEKYGIKNIYDMGSGIGHYLAIENGHIWPGGIAIGGDSHTTGYGGIGAFGSPMNFETVEVMLSGKIWFRVPKTIRIVLDGKLPEGVAARDVGQFLIGTLGLDGALYKAIDYTGPLIKELSVWQRIIFSMLALEMGAKNGFIEPDEKTLEFEKGRARQPFEPVYNDPDAEFEKTLRFDISQLEPQVACPPNPGNVKKIREVEGTRVDQVYVGGCTGGGIEDLRMVAQILDGRKVNSKTRAMIVPGTTSVALQASREGLLDKFLKAGASIMPPYCGPCQMLCVGELAPGERMICTAPRNWAGRAAFGSEVYLASPYTIAASAVEGKIADPRKYL